MTQDEKWIFRYNEVKTFIEENHRNPSKYAEEERRMLHFWKERTRPSVLWRYADRTSNPIIGKYQTLLGEIDHEFDEKGLGDTKKMFED